MWSNIFLISILFVELCIAPPVGKAKEKKAEQEAKYSTEGLTKQQAQDQEYFRYLTQVVGELEKDPEFKKKLHNATEEDIKTGDIVEHLDLIGHGIRAKLDEVKRMEVEYQRDLLRQNKDHMQGVERNYWNPIHHDNKDDFEKEDLRKLLTKHNDMMNEQDVQRRKDFKEYEMEKEHERRAKLKNMTAEERTKEEQRNKESQEGNKKHEKMHEPGSQQELKEVWEKEDGLDPDSFDEKTFFKLHDKNSDGYLDLFELETFFLTDVDKVYNESDPNVDPKERSEEIERMREHVVKTMDKDKDGLISFDEFMSETKEPDYKKDEDWTPLMEEDQYTEQELTDFEKQLEESAGEAEH